MKKGLAVHGTRLGAGGLGEGGTRGESRKRFSDDPPGKLLAAEAELAQRLPAKEFINDIGGSRAEYLRVNVDALVGPKGRKLLPCGF